MSLDGVTFDEKTGATFTYGSVKDVVILATEAYLESNLPRAVFCIPEATYLAWVDVSAYLPKEENLPLYFARNAGVLLEGGNMFVANADGHIRLNLACPRSLLEEGLNRICKALE